MASTPAIFQNKTLRLVKVGKRFVTVEKVKSPYKGEPAYDVYYEGTKIGNVFKLRSKWYADVCYGTRQDCIQFLLTNHIVDNRLHEKENHHE